MSKLLTKLTPDVHAAIAAGCASASVLAGYEPRAVIEAKAALPFLVRGTMVPLVLDGGVAIGTDGKVERQETPADDRVLTFRASVEIVDRQGDLIMLRPNKVTRKKPDGSTLTIEGQGFLAQNMHAAGGPFLWQHNRSFGHPLPPIGQVTRSVFGESEVTVRRIGKRAAAESTSKRSVPTLFQTVKFADQESIPFSRAAYYLVREGVMRAVSIGAIPEVVDPCDDEAEREAIGLKRYGLIYRQMDQIELSLVYAPANPMALLVEGRAADHAAEKAIAGALQQGAHQGALEPSLVSDFLKTYPLSATAAQEALRAKVRSVVPMIARATGEYERDVLEKARGLLGEDEPEPAQSGSQTVRGRADEDREGFVPLPEGGIPVSVGREPEPKAAWTQTPWGLVGPPSVVRSSDGEPIATATVTMETPDGRVRLRLSGVTAGEEVEIVGPCDEGVPAALDAANARQAAAVAPTSTEGLRAALLACWGRDETFIGSLSDAAPTTLVDMATRFLRRQASDRAHVEALARIVEDQGRNVPESLDLGALVGSVGDILAQRQAKAAAAPTVDDDDLPAPVRADIARAFELQSEAASLLGRAVDTLDGHPGATEQEVRMEKAVRQGLESATGIRPDVLEAISRTIAASTVQELKAAIESLTASPGSPQRTSAGGDPAPESVLDRARRVEARATARTAPSKSRTSPAAR